MISKFANSLADAFIEPKQQRLDLNPDHVSIRKTAGMVLHGKKADDIKQFVLNYVRSDLKAAGVSPEINCQISPTGIDKNSNSDIESATGDLILRQDHNTVTIPFVVENGEVSVDVIQVADKTVPYNRENLAKVFNAIGQASRQKQAFDGTSGFINTEKPIATDTDPGFLYEVIRIRDKHVNKGNVDGNYYVYATERLDEALSKTASIHELTPSALKEVEKVAYMAFEKQLEDQVNKVASENEDIEKLALDMRATLANVASIPWKLVYQMKDGQFIAFPEKDGHEIRMMDAVVYKNTKLLRDEDEAQINLSSKDDSTSHYRKEEAAFWQAKKDSTIVITRDYRFIILNDNQPFWAVETEGGWDFKTVSPWQTELSMVYAGIFGNSITYPFVVNHIENVMKFDGVAVSNSGDVGYSSSNQVDNMPKIFKAYCSEYPMKERGFTLVGIPDTRFQYVGRNDVEKTWGTLLRDFTPESASRIMAANSYGHFYATDPDSTQLIPLKGFIRDYLKNPKDLEFTESDSLIKEASAQYVKIDCYDASRGIYDLTLQYKSSVNKVFKTSVKEFKKIDRYTLFAILRTIGFSPNEVAEVVETANVRNHATADLPKDATPENVVGGAPQTKVQKVMGKIMRKALTPDNVSTVGSAIIGEQVSSLADGHEKAQHVIKGIADWSKASELCSIEFEKLAIDTNSPDALDVAKAMATCYHTANALKDAYSGKVMNGFKEAMEAVRESQPEMEKMAYMLISAKISDMKSGCITISPNIITEAVNCLDKLVKVANTAGTTHTEVVCEECGNKPKDGEQLIQGLCPDCYKKEQEGMKDDATFVQDDKDQFAPSNERYSL